MESIKPVNKFVYNYSLDCTRRSVGQEYSDKTVGATACDASRPRIHDQNAQTERFESGCVDKQIFRRSHVVGAGATGCHVELSIIVISVWDK